jgi:hypothetical protein
MTKAMDLSWFPPLALYQEIGREIVAEQFSFGLHPGCRERSEDLASLVRSNNSQAKEMYLFWFLCKVG